MKKYISKLITLASDAIMIPISQILMNLFSPPIESSIILKIYDPNNPPNGKALVAIDK